MLNMQTDLLRTFATVADLRSFTRAGDALGRTQPAISLQIKRLEDLVRAPLFERDSTPLRLTRAGELLATYARQILCLRGTGRHAGEPRDGGAGTRGLSSKNVADALWARPPFPLGR